MKRLLRIVLFLWATAWPANLQASAGTAAGEFLDIPVGAGPAAMGSAYSALAVDAYAPTWNPAGLGILNQTQVTAQHLAYVQDTHYEYASFGLPLARSRQGANDLWCGPSGFGGSIQYFGSGDITGLNDQAKPTGDYSTHFAAYNLSYGRAFGNQLALGLTGKWINAKLADVSANALAADLGSYYKLRGNVQLAATMMNLGGNLTFLNEGDPLPLAFHAAAAYQPTAHWNLSSEWIYPRTGLTSFRMGAEWKAHPIVSLRLGYRTDNLKGLSPISGFSTGIGIHVWNQEFAYAWVPYGDLGDSHYLSWSARFGEERTDGKRNLIQYGRPKKQEARSQKELHQESEGDQLRDLLNNTQTPPK